MGQSIGIMDTLLIVLFTIALFLALHLMETMKIMANQWCYNPLRRTLHENRDLIHRTRP
jgi:hypothetical protein